MDEKSKRDLRRKVLRPVKESRLAGPPSALSIAAFKPVEHPKSEGMGKSPCLLMPPHFFTRTMHLSVLPSTVAVAVVVPFLTKWTVPSPSMVAMEVSSMAQVTAELVPLTFSW